MSEVKSILYASEGSPGSMSRGPAHGTGGFRTATCAVQVALSWRSKSVSHKR